MLENQNNITAKISVDKMLEICVSKSNVIRYLSYKGYKRSEIAAYLNIRYQMVKNILDNDMKLKSKRIDIVAIISDIEAKILVVSQIKEEDVNQLSLKL
jgi:hypothetical protein